MRSARSTPALLRLTELNQLRDRNFFLTGWERYGAAIVAVALGVVIRLVWLQSLGNRFAYLTLYPVVMIAALIGGFGPGLFAALLSVTVVIALWLEPGRLTFLSPSEMTGMGIFLMSSVLVSAVAQMSRRASRQLKERTTALAEANARLEREVERRQNADARLRSSEERFRLAAFSDAITLFEQDADLRYTWLYPEHAEHRGALGRTDAELLPAPEGMDLLRHKQEVIASGTTRRVEVRARFPDQIKYYDTVISPRRSPTGAVVGVAGTALDITARKQVEENRERLAAIVESSDDAIITKDLGGRITSWNQGATRIFGYTAAAAIGQPVAILIPPDRIDEEAAILKAVRGGERIDHYETRRVRRDGSFVDISLTVSPLRDSAGEFVGISKIARDISERVRREAGAQFLVRLNESLAARENAEDILHAASQAMGEHLAVESCYFAQWFGEAGPPSVAGAWHAAGGLAGRLPPLADFRGGSSRRRLIAAGIAISDIEGEAEGLEDREGFRALGIRGLAAVGFVRRDSRLVALIATTARPRAWREDEMQLIKAVAERVWPLVERARSEQALRASERHLRLIADNAPVFLAHFDRGHRYKFANRTYAERFGREPDELVGLHLAEVVGEEAYAFFRSRIEQAFEGVRCEFEAEVPYARIGPRWVHTIYTPEQTPAGAVVGVMGLTIDVTARKHAEQEVELARDEAVAAARAKDDFLAALSHELRTPLNPVLLIASEAAENAALSAPVRRDFATIRKNVELEARLIDDLLDLTRITHGKLPIENRPVDGHAVLQDALSVVHAEAEEKRIALEVALEAATAALKADPVRLQQVFWNVLKNAIKFTSPGGRVRIATRNTEDNTKFVVTVDDTGIGMTERELQRIFDSFVQGDHAGGGSHRFGGLGLGLTISSMLVELHGGTIRAASPGPGQGSTFVIELPVINAADEADALGGSQHAPFASAAGQSLAPRRVLVVEDHAPTRDALASLLRRRQYEVVTAATLEEARMKARLGGISLLVSDLGLPDGDGCELMQELRSRPGLKGIALTGYGMEADMVRTAQAGFIAHLIKPIRVQALDAALALAAQSTPAT